MLWLNSKCGAADHNGLDRSLDRLLENWVKRRLGSVDHERRVREIAGQLFDLASHRHGLASFWRRILGLAAIVHDVGRCGAREDHPQRGAAMILSDPSLPLSPSMRTWLGYLTLHHRRDEDAATGETIRPQVEDLPILRQLLALLRAADALDSRSLESPRLVFAVDRDRLLVCCHLRDECPKADKVYSRRKKFRMLEEMLGREVEIQLFRSESLRMVA